MTEDVDNLALVDALYAALTEVVLEDGDLSRVAEQIASVLAVGALVTSSDGRELGAHLSHDQREHLARARMIEPTGRIRVELIDEPTALGGGGTVAVPVSAAGSDLARLVAVRTDTEIDPTTVSALRRAASLAAVHITRHEAVNAVENKYRGDFLRDVLLRRSGTPSYVAEHAASFGWQLDRPQVVVCAEIDPPAAHEAEEAVSVQQQRRWQQRFAAAWQLVTTTISDDSPSVDLGSEVVTLLQVGPGAPATQTEMAERLVEQAVRTVAGDKGGGRRSFTVGVSRVAHGLANLPDAYAQARRAVAIGRRLRGPGSTMHFDQLGVHRLIALVPDPLELTAFAADVLGPLAEDTAEAADLRETLHRLLDTNFNVAEAARLQFFHYNTMRYRLGKLERILGPLSSDPELRLDVAVALRALEIRP